MTDLGPGHRLAVGYLEFAGDHRPEKAADRRDERVEGKPEVGRALPHQHRDPAGTQREGGLHDESGLAGPRLAGDEDQLPGAVLHRGPVDLQLFQFAAASDPGRQVSRPGPLRRQRGRRPPGHLPTF